MVWLRTKMSVAAQSKELRLMTYNIRTGSKWARIDGKDFANKRTWQDRKRSVAKAIEIGGADVVATQEGLDWQLRELRELLGSWWQSVGAGRIGDGSDDDEHAAILFDSRSVELLLSHDFWLSETPEFSSKSWGASLPRVATYAVFRFGELRFGILNVHLDHSSMEARTQSAKLIRELDKQPQIFFIAGDFNAPKDESWYSELLSNDQMVDAWTQAETRSCGSCGQSTYHAWKGSAAPSTQWIEPFEGQPSREIALSGNRHIDCVFVSRAAISRGRITRARVITDDKRRALYGGPFASDHYPVCIHYALHDAEAHGGSQQPPQEVPDL